MKRVIDGRTYSTETATRIARDDYGSGKDGYFEVLFQTRSGGFFLGGAGGEDSPWGKDAKDGVAFTWRMYWDDENKAYRIGTGDDDIADIRPLSQEEARLWLLNKDEHFVYEHLFCEEGSRSDGNGSTYSLRIPAALRTRAADAADAAGLSLNAWITRAIEQRLSTH